MAIKKNTIKKNVNSKDLNKVATKSIEAPNSSFPIVGIGSSAGGLEAIEQILLHLPANLGMAYVLVSHFAPTQKSLMAEILKKYTTMPVYTITNATSVRPDTIYVIPPDKNVFIQDDLLFLVEQEIPHHINLPIDIFLKSLATDKNKNAVAIILSGTGSDGSSAVRDIKEKGGLVIAEDPLSAKYDNMPRSAISTNCVDFVLSAKNIPEQLIKWLNAKEEKDDELSPELQQIFILLRARTGHDFSSYKLNTINRRIERQMYTHNISTLAEYVRFLRLHPIEVENLFKDLLIGVTSFFRDPETFEFLKTAIFPKILENKPQDYSIRIWVPACSSGEEVYSIAIALCECMDEIKCYRNVQIFGTDIDLAALEVARSGCYSEAISSNVNSERLERFFVKQKNGYKIKKQIRQMIVFGAQNIVKDPPFTKLDFISCRNLLIYLNAQLQKKIFPLFHYSLKSKGILFLGMSEAVSGYVNLFQLIAKKWKIFERKDGDTATNALLNFPTTMPSRYDFTTVFREPDTIDEKNTLKIIHAIRDYLFDQYVPPCVVVNKTGQIFYAHGKLEQCLSLASITNQSNIFEVAQEAIKIVLTPVLHKAVTQKVEVIYNGIHLKNLSGLLNINLIVRPLGNIEALHGMFLVIFESVVESKELFVEEDISTSTINKKILSLELELRNTKENLQATIEEVESSNEELQSTNEELQSTNEEIETSKEELQSLNEELVVVNTELQTRIDELASVNDDMTNLFNSTEIAAFFLDNQLRVKRFTPKAQELINLIQSDIGRSINHFSTNLRYDKLFDDAEEVLKTLIQKSIEVQSKNDQWYLIRILPYRTLLNLIGGVIITFTDISKHKDEEKKLLQLDIALQDSLACSDSIFNAVFEVLLILDMNFQIISANRSFYKTFRLMPEEVIGKIIYDLNNKEWDIPILRKLLSDTMKKKSLTGEYEVEQEFSIVRHKKLILNANLIPCVNSELILLTMVEK
jgi:two-component system CheB/CheR fusion protein